MSSFILVALTCGTSCPLQWYQSFLGACAKGTMNGEQNFDLLLQVCKRCVCVCACVFVCLSICLSSTSDRTTKRLQPRAPRMPRHSVGSVQQELDESRLHEQLQEESINNTPCTASVWKGCAICNVNNIMYCHRMMNAIFMNLNAW